MRSASEGVEALRAALLEQGGTASELLGDASADLLDEPGPAQLASAGPRASANAAEYELLVEMIYEGSRLHYGPQRLVRTDDPDLALLVGDQLYALGLARLAELGDLPAVRALADVIAQVAEARAAGDEAAAAAAWDAGARAVGWGAGQTGSSMRRSTGR
jgi:hypothetical protein